MQHSVWITTTIFLVLLLLSVLLLLAYWLLVETENIWNFRWHENRQINTMQHYKYQLSAPSSSETLTPAVKGVYLFEPKWNIMSAEEEKREAEPEREEEEIKPKHVAIVRTAATATATWGSRPAFDPFRCALWPGCVCEGGDKASLGLSDERWPCLTTAGVELCCRTDTAFINARRPSQCCQQRQCNNCVCVCVVRGEGRWRGRGGGATTGMSPPC